MNKSRYSCHTANFKLKVTEYAEDLGNSSFERNLLVELVLERKHIVENKRTDGASVNEKRKCWEEISTCFNASRQTENRTTKQLKELYFVLKRNARKHNNEDKLWGTQQSTGNLSAHAGKVKAFFCYAPTVLTGEGGVATTHLYDNSWDCDGWYTATPFICPCVRAHRPFSCKYDQEFTNIKAFASKSANMTERDLKVFLEQALWPLKYFFWLIPGQPTKMTIQFYSP
ncbi:hypothetical protein C0J52_01094 [Blattella germanica]|nr:hypothetical protein C0J52_01094 [Blattella germanica]